MATAQGFLSRRPWVPALGGVAVGLVARRPLLGLAGGVALGAAASRLPEPEGEHGAGAGDDRGFIPPNPQTPSPETTTDEAPPPTPIISPHQPEGRSLIGEPPTGTD